MGNGELLYLSKSEVEAAGLSMGEIIELVETAFREKGGGRVEMPPKPGIHPGGGDNFIHAMPAYIPAMKSAGMKWVSGYPENQKQGLPYINGLLILNDPETGLPKGVMDCVWITAMRTAAATAVAARRLARSDSAVLGILGCGVQGLTNTEALRTVLPIKKVIGYDINREALHRFTGEVRKRFELETKEAATPREAVTGCDIIVTAGPILKIPHATIQAGWMDEGAFASLVDFDSYWHPDAMRESDKFCTDDIDQLEHYRSIGYFQGIPPVYADLGELAVGAKPGRQDPYERTIACNLGLAIDDMAVAPAVYERSVEKGIGTRLLL